MRILQIKTPDGMQKKLQVDDSHTVGQLMVTICTKMGRWWQYTIHMDNTPTDRQVTICTKMGEWRQYNKYKTIHRQTDRSPSVPK